MNKYINIMIITIECNQCDNSYDVPTEVPVTHLCIRYFSLLTFFLYVQRMMLDNHVLLC